jgi:hypothetical protein
MANYPSYKIPVNSDDIHMLTNKKCDVGIFRKGESIFIIREIEVWGVTFLE